MPSITLEILKTSKERKERLVREITRVAAEATGVPADAFYVFIKENEPDNVGVGGVLLSNRK